MTYCTNALEANSQNVVRVVNCGERQDGASTKSVIVKEMTIRMKARIFVIDGAEKGATDER